MLWFYRRHWTWHVSSHATSCRNQSDGSDQPVDASWDEEHTAYTGLLPAAKLALASPKGVPCGTPTTSANRSPEKKVHAAFQEHESHEMLCDNVLTRYVPVDSLSVREYKPQVGHVAGYTVQLRACAKMPALRAICPETQRTSCACPGLRVACRTWAADSEPRHIVGFCGPGDGQVESCVVHVTCGCFRSASLVVTRMASPSGPGEQVNANFV